MFASINSCMITGVTGTPLRVEVHSSSGLPGYTVVGMPDTAMRESKERIRAAMISSRMKWPQSRMTINLAPASVRKSGTGAELAILIGLLCTSGILDARRFSNAGVIGELGLDGKIHEVAGTIARVSALRECGVTEVFVPLQNAYEASLVSGVEIFPLESVCGLVESLTTGEPWPTMESLPPRSHTQSWGDYSDVSGQPLGCEAMMLLAAGGHHTLLMGSPGIGKTMLAERLPSILSDLDEQSSLEVSAITSVIEGSVSELQKYRPFQTPHHSASAVSMIGGGSTSAVPGEVTRAHKGVLFLDELAEFSVPALDALRQPLEKGIVSISRAHFSTTLPAEFTLLACSNPCPCARAREKCICSDAQRSRYLRRLSGPLLDRFDIRLELVRSDFIDRTTHSSATMKEKVLTAQSRQRARQMASNAHLSSAELAEVSPLSRDVALLYRELIEKREVSGRGATAIWRVARTLADVDDREHVNELDITTAFDLREEIK
jgi:magnesium chelatase family protein